MIFYKIKDSDCFYFHQDAHAQASTKREGRVLPGSVQRVKPKKKMVWRKERMGSEVDTSILLIYFLGGGGGRLTGGREIFSF